MRPRRPGGVASTDTDAAEAFRTTVATLQVLDPVVLQAVLTAATANNQMRAAATSMAAAMVGAGSPPTGGRSIVTPGALSPSLLNPEEMRELMAGNATTPPGPPNAAKPAAASTRQGRVTFTLPDNSNRSTLLTKLREQEREQEEKDNLVEFLSNQGTDMPQNREEFGEWLSRVDEPIAVLAMVHDEKHAQAMSNVLRKVQKRPQHDVL